MLGGRRRYHLRAQRARALEKRRRLERAKNEDKPWTPEETAGCVHCEK